MPCIEIHIPSDRNIEKPTSNALPSLLQTPSGLAMVEIQGTIHMPPPTGPEALASESATESMGRTMVGRLEFPNDSSNTPADDQSWMKRVYLYVGKHQRMTGEVKKLPKPIGVLSKRIDGDEARTEEHLELREIIKYKIVFSQRPEPVGEGER